MINGPYGNHICFGYGDIAVGAVSNIETFRWFKPSQDVGTKIEKDVEWLSDVIKLEFIELRQISILRNKLNEVKETDTKTFTYCGLVFDFSNYNEKSVDIVLEHLKYAEDNLTFLYAV